MKFFDELPLDELQEDESKLTENQKTEKLVLETINEMIKKINDVQFIGHAEVFRLASEALGKIDLNNKEEIKKDFSQMREAVKGLSVKLEAENDISIRVQLTGLVKNERFIPNMQKIIAQGKGTAEEKEAMQAKLQAFVDAQNSTQGYGALCARDLVLVIQMIETLMEALKNFQKKYAAQITAKNKQRIAELQSQLEAAQNPILKSVINLLELNEPEFRETKLAVSNLEPGMVDSMVNVSVEELPPQDTAQVMADDINDILIKNTKNPKLIQSPHLIQNLDETIPKNIFSDEDLKEKNISLREFLTQYRFAQKSEKEAQAGYFDTFFAIPGKLLGYIMDTVAWVTWKNSVSQNLASYLASYYYGTGDDKPAQVDAKQPQADNKLAHADDKQPQAKQTAPASLTSYCYQKMQNVMDVVWEGLGYNTALKASTVIEHYKENIAPIKAKYETPSKPEEVETPALAKNKAEEKETSPNIVKRVQTVNNNKTPTQSILLDKIDRNMEQKYQQLQKGYSEAYIKFQTVVKKLNLYVGNDNRVKEHLKIKLSPCKEDMIGLKKLTANLLIEQSQVAVNINLNRGNQTSHKKAEARDIEASMKPLLKLDPTASAYESLIKETLSLCSSYSTKLIKPAPQRITAINWLYHVMQNLNNNDKITDDNKYNVLTAALNKVLEESHHHHANTSFFGACGLNNSKLAAKISDLLRKYGVKVTSGDRIFTVNRIQTYEDFTSQQNQRSAATPNF